MVDSASISSRIFIEPSWRCRRCLSAPATMMATIRTPISRSTECRQPCRRRGKKSAPNLRKWKMPCCAMMAPIRKVISTTMGIACQPTRCLIGQRRQPQRSRPAQDAQDSRCIPHPASAGMRQRLLLHRCGTADIAELCDDDRAGAGAGVRRLIDEPRRSGGDAGDIGTVARGTGSPRHFPIAGRQAYRVHAPAVDLVGSGAIELRRHVIGKPFERRRIRGPSGAGRTQFERIARWRRR